MLQLGSPNRTTPIASAPAPPGASPAVASQSLPTDLGIEATPTRPSPTRQASPSIARSGSTSRVIAQSVTASTRAQKQLAKSRRMEARM
jgi:hypothetical protein